MCVRPVLPELPAVEQYRVPMPGLARTRIPYGVVLLRPPTPVATKGAVVLTCPPWDTTSSRKRLTVDWEPNRSRGRTPAENRGFGWCGGRPGSATPQKNNGRLLGVQSCKLRFDLARASLSKMRKIVAGYPGFPSRTHSAIWAQLKSSRGRATKINKIGPRRNQET